MRLREPFKDFLELAATIKMVSQARWLSEIPVDDIMRALEWNQSDLPHKLFVHYFRVVEGSLLARAYKRSSHQSRWLSLAKLYEELPLIAQIRVCSAPITYELVGEWSERDLEVRLTSFESILRAELALQGLRSPSEPCWTALGDAFIGTIAGQHVVERTAPRTKAGIVVDFDSPWSYFGATDRHPNMAITSPGDRARIVDRLNEAEEQLQSTSVNAASLVAAMTRTICVRDDSASKQSFGSSSWSWEVGKTGLTNVLNPWAAGGRLTSGILHESIHSLLYIVETVRPTFTKSPLDIQLRSTWSGRDLPVSSITHACFVWYGLYWFWRRNSDSNEERDRAANGFLKGYRSLIRQLQPFLNPEVDEILHVMGSRVRASV